MAPRSPSRAPLWAILLLLLAAATHTSASCSTCAAGTVCDTTSNSTCVTCPQGYYCAGGTSAAVACTRGYASSATGANSSSTCQLCDAGTYSTSAGTITCTSCEAGYECAGGTSLPSICSAGYYAGVGASACSSCDPGYVSIASGATACLPCPAGFTCAGSTSTSTQCSAGTYSLMGSTACSSCASGTWSLAGSGSCQACPSGWYTTTKTSCTECAAGSSCTSTGTTTCAAGTFSVAGQASCSQCPSGYTSSSGASSCTACSKGYYCSSTTSTACAAGSISQPAATSCTTCTIGTYADSTQSSCVVCPAGYACPTPTASAMVACTGATYSPGGIIAACLSCPNGTVSQGGTANTDCVVCTAGYACAGGVSTACAAGTYSSAGSSICTTCPAGYSCAAATSTPTACTNGTRSALGASSCTTCTAGSYCPTTSAPSIACASGYYSAAGAVVCTICPAGSQCSSGTSAVACTSGTYALAGAVACTKCVADYACPSLYTAPIACPRGYTAAAGATACTICDAGYTCVNGTRTACVAGTYALAGSTSCTACPAGYYCPSTSTVPTVCTLGTYSIGSQTACTGCPAGYRCPFTMTNDVYACKPGEYSTGNAAVCTLCAAGTACPSTNSSTTITCTSGQYAVSGSTSCTTCPAGKACSDVTGATIDTCNGGTYSLAGATKCSTCPAGYACSSTTSSSATACTTGTYALAGSTTCLSCPAGFTCATTTDAPAGPCSVGTYSLANSTSCTTCPAGNACPHNNEAPEIDCPSGTYAPAGSASCITCSAGYYCATALTQVACAAKNYSFAGWTECLPCPAGYTCTTSTGATTAGTAASPALCSAGYYALYGSSTCTQCTAGYYCPEEGMTEMLPQSFVCPPGSYCTTGLSAPTPCPSGTYNLYSNATSSSWCLTCPAGYYCVAGTANFNNAKCPPGYACPAGTGGADTKPVSSALCPAGTWSNKEQLVIWTQCQSCSAGYYCAAGSSYESVCPAGYYCPDTTQAVCPAGTSSCDTYSPTPCPAGTWSSLYGLTTSTQCQICPAGYYCPAASIYPTPCPAGTYNTAFNGTSSSSCLLCIAGMSCPFSGLVGPISNCSTGHYCPAGTVFPSDQPCPPGYYTDSQQAVMLSDCVLCPPGFTCGFGSGGTQNPPIACTAGYYCPTGSSAGIACPAGYYSNSTTATVASDCLPCPAGYYCLSAATTPTAICGQGSYCPMKSTTVGGTSCPAGTYGATTGLSRVDQCTPCPLGQWCPVGSAAPTSCIAGTYNPYTSQSTITACLVCPAGYTCPNTQMSYAYECGMGRYSSSGSTAVSCPGCVAGYYCPNTTTSNTTMHGYPCPPGTMCPANVSRVPDWQDYQCGLGHYCPGQTVPPGWPCPAGTYNPNYGAKSPSDCLDCPAGMYCLGGDSVPSGNCSAGYYCTGKSSTPTQVACPAGTYRGTTGGGSVIACGGCPGGYYCPTAALVSPIICPMGKYCTPNVTIGIDCPKGTFGNTTGLQAAALCTACSTGHYCATPGLTAPTGPCKAGYYCTTGAGNSMADGEPAIGGECPIGGYCPEGSSASTACPTGTYGNTTRLTNSSGCIPCPAGSYCLGSNLNAVSGACAAGYYCVAGTGEAQPASGICTAGHYCPTGSGYPKPCGEGTFQLYIGSSVCLDCTAGYYCPYNTSLADASIQRVDCPVGYYCPAKSSSPTSCPAGTYGASIVLQSSDQCTPCTAGYYCTGGANAPIICDAGRYCAGNNTNSLGTTCPAGAWCGRGSTAPTACGPTYYSALTGATNISVCTSCTSGYYCSEQEGATVTGPCTAGYYCPTGSVSPTENLCPEGYYCPTASGSPFACTPGNYSVAGASLCSTCVAGYYCTGTASMTLCLEGHYCPTGVSRGTSCPNGTYGPTTGLTSSSECTVCEPGHYCATVGISAPTGTCSAGYACWGGQSDGAHSAQTSQGATGLITSYVLCPTGYYCPAGEAPIECPIGTYLAITGASSVSQCTYCPARSYCAGLGLSAVSGPCSAGYFCGGNATSATPTELSYGAVALNGVCPVGYYCPDAGTRVPTPCPAGTYADTTGQTSCTTCPLGYYCESGASTYSYCPAGYYCPANTTSPYSNPCPTGRYSAALGLYDVSQCTECDVGEYCETLAALTPTGYCDGGFYCILGAKVQNPTDGTTGRACSQRYYCPNGTTTEVLCPANYYCSGALAAPNGLCSAGYYCLTGEMNSTAHICPAGAYCQGDTNGVQYCPVGTVSDTVGASSSTTCDSCPAGKYCNATGMLSTQAADCPAGYYCPAGTISPDQSPAALCSAGHYCPTGSKAEQPCGPGYYQDLTGATSCKTTTAGYYTVGAVNNGSSLILCPAGSYCPAGTNSPTQYLCPPGTFGSNTGQSSVSSCVECPGGYYCDTYGETLGYDDSKLCEAGYYCTGGALTSMPTDGTTGALCPYGSYCVEGSAQPTPCPAGTLANGNGSRNVSDCTTCPAGKYCTGSTISSVPFCSAGYWCISGSTTATPTTLPMGEACPAGTYCLEGNIASPPQCQPGTWNPDEAQSSCPDCPASYYCPYNGTSSLGGATSVSGSTCPAGAYCAGGNISPTPCPAGRYSTATGLTDGLQCSNCTTGNYCAGPVWTAPTGTCDAGFFCSTGSSTPQPNGTYPNSGKCPAGSYCLAGTQTPTLCPQGTYNPNLQLASVYECSNCTAGSYCATAGLTAVTGLCTAGYYCPLNSIVPNAVVCPAGSYCVAGSPEPVQCPDASYNSQTGQSTCRPCEAGWTCTNGSTVGTQAPCPYGSYCLSGTLPQPCPAGYYGDRTGLESAGECAVCEPGVYCSGSGFITGNCSAGYLCTAGSYLPNPTGPLNPTNSTVNAGPCPAGYYCPRGTLNPIVCPTGTSRLETGGSSVSDCGPCPAGYECLSNIPMLCAAGFYCPINNTYALPCPLGTYNPTEGAYNLSSCLLCPGGYTCTMTNMSSYDNFPCPVGYYCPPGTQVDMPCPSGTYRADIAGADAADCAACPAGYYCGPITSAPNPCKPGQYCPESSTEQGPCPAGYYCAHDVNTSASLYPIVPRICPEGFFCPLNSSAPNPCVSPYYCPEGSATNTSCPKGYEHRTFAGLRTSLDQSCRQCKAGQYSVTGDDPKCYDCPAGYVCLEGCNTATPTNVTTDYGFECGPGTYCPIGSSAVSYCSAGTYQPYYGMVSKDDCLPCASNSYSDGEGSATCTPCGSSAYADSSAQTCTCNGTYRSYQITDGSCKCQPGYEYYDSSNTLYTGDSPDACQPIVYSECSGEVRDSQGNCVSDLVAACDEACAGSALRLANAQCDSSLIDQDDGTLDSNTGVCICVSEPLVSYCDADCFANASTITLSSSGDFTVVDSASGSAATVTQSQLTSSFGLFAPQLTCTATDGCSVSSVVTSSTGHRALIDLPPTMASLAGFSTTGTATICNYTSTGELQSYAGSESVLQSEMPTTSLFSSLGIFTSLEDSATRRAAGAARRRSRSLSRSGSHSSRSFYTISDSTDDSLQTLKGYYNPTMCVQVSGAVYWQIDDSTHYPVYQKDNFLNSNADFDYGVFLQLAAQLEAGTVISSFAFTFTAAGVYVFSDAVNTDHLTIIVVLAEDQPCPSGYTILPTATSSLTSLGVGTTSEATTKPNLTLIWALLGMFIGLVLIVALIAKLKQKKALRALDLAAEDEQAISDFRQLYHELVQQRKQQKGMFNKQRDHFRSECDRICAETEQVKALLATKMTDGRGFVDAAINLLLQELTARNSYGNRQGRREDDMFSTLAALQRILTDAASLEDPSSIQTAAINEQVESVATKLGDVIREAEKERARKRHLESNAGIIGDEIVKKLTEHSFEEEAKENAFLDKLRAFRAQCVDYKSNMSEMQTDLDEKVKVLLDRRNAPAAETAQIKFQRKVRDAADGLNLDLERMLSLAELAHTDLKAAREETVEDENEALESLEQRKLDVEAKAQTGIFAGLDEELAEAIRLFLLQARRELLPIDAAFETGAMMGGNMMLGRGFGQGEYGGGGVGYGSTAFGGAGFGTTGGGYGPGGKRSEGQPGESHSSGLAPTDMVEATSAELAAANDEEAERARRVALENADAMNVDDLRQLYADLRQREEMMEHLQRSEEDRQKRLAEEILKSTDLAPEEELMLSKARELLDTMVEAHRREEEELHAAIKSDEEARIAAEIAALESVEKSIERKKADLALEMARRNELAASESEKTEIAHEHQVQLKSLEESLRADKINSQKALSKIHEDMRARLRQAKKDLRAKHKVEESEVRADFERVKEDVERRIDERSVKIEGVDLNAIKKQLGDAATAEPSAKQQALANFHLQTQQDIKKRQQGEERKLADENEKERQRELDLLDNQYRDRRAQELEELEERLRQERESLDDEDQMKALLLQHQNQLASVAHEMDAEHARQKAHLAAALAKKRKMREAKLKGEHTLEMEKELLEQKKEMDSVEQAAIKRKETNALGLILTKENHRKAKAIIEKLIKPRQAKEVALLLQDNFKEAALALSEELEKAIEIAAHRREDVERRLAANEITLEEAQHELQAISESVNPEAINASTLQYLEPKQNEKLTQQKRAHFQEVKDLMRKFYPDEKFDGAEWTMEDQTVNVAAMLKEAEERRIAQEAAYQEQLRELERREAEQLKALEQLKADKMKEMEAQLAEDNRRMQAEFEAQLQAKRREFEATQRNDTDRAVAGELAALEVREAQMRRMEEAARQNTLSEDEKIALAREKEAIAEEKAALLSEAAESTREQQRQYELEADRQRKKNANKQLQREQELKLAALEKLEAEHMMNIEQQKKNLAESAEKLKAHSEEEEMRKKENIQLAARAFVKFGAAYNDHRAIGIRNAVRRIRKLYDKTRAGKGVPFGLVPGPAAGTMVQVPLQPGMPLIGGGGAVVGEGSVAGASAGGALGAIGGGLGAGFPGVGESGVPFFNKLEKIENQLQRMMKSANDGLFAPDLLPYFTAGEEALVCEGTKIEEIDLSKLTPKKFVLYRFGLFILDFLAEAHACPTIRLLFSKNLPAKPDAQKYAENAFKNSFHFDPLTRTLFVRTERTEEVGEFTLLLIHTLSHVLAGTWSDAHPKFQECFYRSLQFICSELFFARTKKGLGGFGGGRQQMAQLHAAEMLQAGGGDANAVVLSAADDALTYREFRDLFGLVHKLELKEDLVGEFLDLHGISGADDRGDFFAEDLLTQRMEQYRLYNYSAPLKAHLKELERNVVAKQTAAVQEELAPNESGMLMTKIGDKTAAAAAAKRPAAAAAKEAQSVREKYRASVDRLLEESDGLHTQLLGIISAMSPVSEALLVAQEASERLAASKSKDAAAIADATARRKELQAKLRRLNLQKTAVNQRIEDVEAKYKQASTELAK